MHPTTPEKSPANERRAARCAWKTHVPGWELLSAGYARNPRMNFKSSLSLVKQSLATVSSN
jgi:hypothetical protein